MRHLHRLCGRDARVLLLRRDRGDRVAGDLPERALRHREDDLLRRHEVTLRRDGERSVRLVHDAARRIRQEDATALALDGGLHLVDDRGVTRDRILGRRRAVPVDRAVLEIPDGIDVIDPVRTEAVVVEEELRTAVAEHVLHVLPAALRRDAGDGGVVRRASVELRDLGSAQEAFPHRVVVFRHAGVLRLERRAGVTEEAPRIAARILQHAEVLVVERRLRRHAELGRELLRVLVRVEAIPVP